MQTETHLRPARRHRWARWAPWIEWTLAVVAAEIVFNLNVTSAGDPLSGVRGAVPNGPAPGITMEGRTSFYVALAVVGAVLVAGTLVLGAMPRRSMEPVLPAVRAFGFVALAGLAGLLLDVPDGPIRTVENLVYVAVFLAGIRFVRLVHGFSAELAASGPETSSR